ncbi:dephospho-CoA kinase [Lichenifustis flavocetrariae]|uniref:Dephospho-CoA kinase n=1 Tax=Lichenifustis flavocetrariae TaxID=2949735 RepID=A0AA41YRH8_9HYPH|nr:dephospho-CoA kinase [Lichenifustis flavocetrariae]MCW6506834.1 dephospho-CoA kinase [Lichenifustis flavocetrariae]
MLVLGLTGSIGMGKSTTAQMFRDEGIPVHDADAEVHALYRGAAVGPVAAIFPEVVRDRVIDRALLRARVLDDGTALRQIESIVHPLVRAAREAFLAEMKAKGAAVVVLDIPLLFETGAEGEVDRVVVVSAPESVQKARVLARPGMTAEHYSAILAKQMPDAEKRRRADWVIETGDGIGPARAKVRAILAEARVLAA